MKTLGSCQYAFVDAMAGGSVRTLRDQYGRTNESMEEADLTFPGFRLERKLHFRIGGEWAEGILSIGDLQWKADEQRWVCHWSVSFVHPEIGKTHGADPLDAFLKAVDFLSVLMRGSEDDGLEVSWKEEGDHAGLVFPLSEGRKWKEVPPGYKGQLPPGLRLDGGAG